MKPGQGKTGTLQRNRHDEFLAEYPRVPCKLPLLLTPAPVPLRFIATLPVIISIAHPLLRHLRSGPPGLPHPCLDCILD